MAENINALILPIGADPSQFQKSINDVKAAYKELSNTIASTPFNLVTAEQKTLLSQYGETIKTLTNDVKQFGAALGPPANSIAGLDKKISELNKKKINLDAKTSASEIARLTKEIEKLTQQRNNIDALGASVQKIGQAGGSSFKKLEDSSKGGRIALTSLSLVAQDLPFGFIAIQNNLPAVIQSFGQLTSKSGGLKGALSEIGPLLLGPAGLFLAFSIVTSAVTFAVQKYGSLGAALDAIIGKQSKYSELLLEANKSYEKFNKEKRDSIQIFNEEVASIEGTISKVTSLASIVTDLTKSYDERNSALNDLKSLDKERFGNLDIEKTKLEDLTSALDNYISSLKAAAITKGFESAIGQTSVELAKQVKILDTLKDELADAKAAPVRFIGKADQVDTRDIDAATARIKEQDKVVNALRNDISLYNKEIDTTVKLQNSLQAPIDAANKAFKDLTKNLKDQKAAEDDAANAAEKRLQALNKFNQLKINLPKIEDSKAVDRNIAALEKYGNIVLDTTKYDFERAAALKEIIEIDKEYFKNLDLTKTKLETLQGTIQNYIGYLYNVRELQKELAKPIDIGKLTKSIETQILIDTSKLRTNLPAVIDLLFPDEKFNKIAESWSKINKDTSPKIEELKNKIRDGLISNELVTGVKSTYEEISNAINSALSGVQIGFDQEKKLADTEKQIKAFTERINSAIEDGLRRPLRDFFGEFLDTGKFAFDSFVKLAKDSFKRIAADLLASGLAKLLTSFLLPMAGGAAAGGASGFASALMGLLPPSRARTRFESISPRRESSGGQVNFVIRGTELVGVLNRGNQEINRIG